MPIGRGGGGIAEKRRAAVMARSRREIPRFQFWGSATTLPPSGPGCQRVPRHVWLLRGVQQTAARRVGADSSAAGSSGVCHTKSSYSDGSCCCSEPSNQWTLLANKFASRDPVGRKYSIGSKSETLQHAAFIFDRNLNTNVTITQDQPKPEFASEGATRQEIFNLSKIFTE